MFPPDSPPILPADPGNLNPTPPPPPPTDPLAPTDPYTGGFQVVLDAGGGIPVTVLQDGMLLGCGLSDPSGVYIPGMAPGPWSPTKVRAVIQNGDILDVFQSEVMCSDFKGYQRLGFPATDPAATPKAGAAGYNVEFDFIIKSMKDGTPVVGALVDIYDGFAIGPSSDYQALSSPAGVVAGVKGFAKCPSYITIVVTAPGYKGAKLTLDITYKVGNQSKFALKHLWMQPN